MGTLNAKNIPVFKPELPTAETLLPYLKRIDSSAWYTNMGPLVREFEERIGTHFGVPADQVVTCVNGTIGLTVALWALGSKPGSHCAMPSWTFVATCAAAIAAGLTPLFLDVDRKTWALDGATLVETISRSPYDVGAVIPVAPFGAPMDVKPWDSFKESTGIPVIIDAAAAFDSFGADFSPASGDCPFMISFHATKSLAMGEGAAIITRDSALAKEIRKLTNFGFHGSRNATVPGINAKISEYTAAVGLASLDEWPVRRSRWQQITSLFLSRISTRNELAPGPNVGEGWVSVYGNVELAEQFDVPSIIEALAIRGVEARSWWGEGAHKQPAYNLYPHLNLPNTNYLGQHVIGLPFWLGLDDRSMDFVFHELSESLGQM